MTFWIQISHVVSTQTLRPSSQGNGIVPFHLHSNFWDGQIGCSHGNGTIACQLLLCSDGNAIVPLKSFPFACSNGNKRNDCVLFYFSDHFFSRSIFGSERLYFKGSCLNATFQRSAFGKNTERSGTAALPCERDLENFLKSQNPELNFLHFLSS